MLRSTVSNSRNTFADEYEASTSKTSSGENILTHDEREWSSSKSLSDDYDSAPSTTPREDTSAELNSSTTIWPTIGTSILIVLVVALITGGWILYRLIQWRKVRLISWLEIDHFFNGRTACDLEPQRLYLNRLPYDRDMYEVAAGTITIDWTKILGRGQFGVVLQGTDVRSGQIVAVKTVSSQDTIQAEPNPNNTMELLSELKILAKVGHHNHVVNLIGAQTTRVSEGVVFLFVEYCPLGDLESYLRQKRDNFGDCAECGRGIAKSGAEKVNDGGDLGHTTSTCPTGYSTPTEISRAFNTQKCGPSPHGPDDTISPCDLIRWSAQTASAMAYLASRRVVHGDLATRNILLLNKDCVKLTDFGLAKHVYRYTNYVSKPEGSCMPWRSMAPESFVDLCFTTDSDVWSFGMTLWEIFSLGAVPYEDDTEFPGTVEFLRRLSNECRLSKLKYIPVNDPIYEDIILQYWNIWLENRPSFAELQRNLSRMEQVCWLHSSTSDDETDTKL